MDWLSGDAAMWKVASRKRITPLAWSNTCCLGRMHCLCCSFFTLSAKQNRVNKPRGNWKVREQIVSFHTDFNFLYTVSVIVLAVSWMCVYSEACHICGRFNRNSLTLFGGNKSTVGRRLVRLHLFYRRLPVPLGHPLIRFACWCISQLKTGPIWGIVLFFSTLLANVHPSLHLLLLSVGFTFHPKRWPAVDHFLKFTCASHGRLEAINYC